MTKRVAGKQKAEMDPKIINWVESADDRDASVFDEIEISTRLMIRLADALSMRFDQGHDQLDRNVAILLYREALKRQCLPLFPRHRCLIKLANALEIRSMEQGKQSDLDEAIYLYGEALYLPQLASALYTRFMQRGQKADLDKAISAYRESIQRFLPSGPERVSLFNNLAAALVARSKHSGQRTDLDEAISLHKQALELRSPFDPDRCDSLYNLADAMFTLFKFDAGGNGVDLDEAISIHRQALELRPPSHPKRLDSLQNLALALSTRFEGGGHHSDIDEVILLNRQALELQLSPHPDRPMFLTDLAASLSTRFRQRGQRTDLDEAIFLRGEALKLLPLPHPDRSIYLENAAIGLLTRFEQGGQNTDLEQAILMHRQALELRLPSHPDRCDTLSNLAGALSARFEQGGQQIDLDESIFLERQALDLRLSPHPDRYMSLSNLATQLETRFRQTGQKTDLDEAILLHREALELVPPPHPDRPLCLNNVANGLSTRFKQGGQETDLDQAISMHRQALQARLPPHPDRSISLSNLAIVLQTRFNRRGQEVDLDEAISFTREALQLRPSPHPDRYMSLTNLASALLTSFQQRRQRTDLDEAISLSRQALDLQSPLHPGRSTTSRGLGVLFIQAHRKDNNSEYLDNAMSSFATATRCLSQSPSQRLDAAKLWVHYSNGYQHISAIDAYEAALQTLPQVAALSFDVQSRQEALTACSDGLARDASRCAIRSGNFGKAIEFLEAGRSIFWSQVLSLRSSFDQIHDIAPELADNLRDIAIALELGSHRDVSSQMSNNRKKVSLEQDVFRMNRLNEEWEKAVNDARKLDGFKDFLRTPRLSSLQSAASKHPVILLVANDDGSHCLIMTSTSIHHIPLPILYTEPLQDLIYFVQVGASQLQVSRAAIKKTHKNVLKHLGEQHGMRYKDDNLVTSDDIFRFVLAILWELVVKPVIGALDIKKSGEMPILQWCPTGAFTFLPIHAAGRYNPYSDEGAHECASNYFITTYIPTIGTLLEHPPVPSTQDFKMMVVIQSSELPSAKQELERIQKHVPSTSLVKFGVPGAVANVEAVASHLSDSSIVHFACHGKQDKIKPLNSGLTLDDGILKISRIMKEKIPSGTLAFLCACETAMGDQKLPDEAMSLGASFLFSGFRRVVATMWEMQDADGPAIADIFYEELFRGPDAKPVLKPDTTKSAQALHVAVKKLRSQNVGFARWVPFIHMGM